MRNIVSLTRNLTTLSGDEWLLSRPARITHRTYRILGGMDPIAHHDVAS
jgi:hypothetical protein